MLLSIMFMFMFMIPLVRHLMGRGGGEGGALVFMGGVRAKVRVKVRVRV